MSQEINVADRAAEAIANLRRRGQVKPLRGVGRAPEGRQTTLSVADLKNGGTLDLDGLLAAPEAGAAEGGTLRQRAGGGRASARQSRSEGLSLPERLDKLAKIKKSATEYESLFIDQLVKLMRPSPLANLPGGDTFSELAEQPFREFLSQAGGLGLANTIVGQIARQEGLEQTLQEHPEVMGPSWRPVIPRNLGPRSGTRLSLTPADLEPQAADQGQGLKGPAEPAGT